MSCCDACKFSISHTHTRMRSNIFRLISFLKSSHSPDFSFILQSSLFFAFALFCSLFMYVPVHFVEQFKVNTECLNSNMHAKRIPIYKSNSWSIGFEEEERMEEIKWNTPIFIVSFYRFVLFSSSFFFASFASFLLSLSLFLIVIWHIRFHHKSPCIPHQKLKESNVCMNLFLNGFQLSMSTK